MMFSVTTDLYRRLAAELLDRFADQTYYSGSVTLDEGETACRLTGSYLIYRTSDCFPEGSGSRIADVVPVWWEFHTVGAEGETDNDFSFRELRPLLPE